ncbi:MAG: flavodoxin [Ruminococcus sp.]|nr:flavodoxin [Ruminococcus sp.]
MKKLVAYFSASGVTERAAELIKKTVSADIFEIMPEEPYKDSDLKWINPLARCNKEKIGKKDIPIAKKVKGMENYGFVFIGFPIWYYGAPNIILSFLKQYDFSGKKIALFATSGGSDIDKTAEKLKPVFGESVQIVGAKRFYADTSREVIAEWARQMTEK